MYVLLVDSNTQGYDHTAEGPCCYYGLFLPQTTDITALSGCGADMSLRLVSLVHSISPTK